MREHALHSISSAEEVASLLLHRQTLAALTGNLLFGDSLRCPLRSARPRSWLVTTRYSSWEVYGKVQEAVAKDPEFATLLRDTTSFAELTARNIAVGVDL
jgi:hypothetical protein